MTGWRELDEELDAWASAGRRASLWWRDDDAVESTPALERLLGLSDRFALPLTLAVIPERLSSTLVRRLAAASAVTPVQHGFAHRNHAAPGAKKIELGTERPLAAVLEELARGWSLLEGALAGHMEPVLVPPWNRIAPEVAAALPGLGYRGLSVHGPRSAALAAPGLWQVNTHADIMRWSAPRGFLGEAAALGVLRGHLASRRLGQPRAVDPDEPTGILTHHLAHDEAAWDFLEHLLERLAKHPGACFPAAAEVFARQPARQAAAS